MDVVDIGAKLALIYMPFLFALCFHEFAHGYVAKLRGDNTAQMMGRLTLNPMAHIDWLGTVILPILSIVTNLNIFFGWAKPVPVNERNLKKPRTDMFWIALAGPMSNVLLAIIGAFIASAIAVRMQTSDIQQPMAMLLSQFILTNLFLAIFNLIPIHPLDGGKVLARFLPTAWNYKLEQNQQQLSFLLLLLFISGALRFLVYPVYFSYQVLLNFFGAFFHA
ncbi:MAG: site-2 protease family protein [Bdellovibrionota bacterium]